MKHNKHRLELKLTLTLGEGWGEGASLARIPSEEIFLPVRRSPTARLKQVGWVR
jgi:hypothetical protein